MRSLSQLPEIWTWYMCLCFWVSQFNSLHVGLDAKISRHNLTGNIKAASSCVCVHLCLSLYTHLCLWSCLIALYSRQCVILADDKPFKLKQFLCFSCMHVSSVCDEHREFKDMKLFYRFRKDDGTFPLDSEAKVFMRGQRIYEKYVRTCKHTPEIQHRHTHQFPFKTDIALLSNCIHELKFAAC